jgi:hypothetical protein
MRETKSYGRHDWLHDGQKDFRPFTAETMKSRELQSAPWGSQDSRTPGLRAQSAEKSIEESA